MVSVVLLGEKDHGKSTMIGRLIYETKSLPDDKLKDVKSAIKKSQKKFEWAHLLDSFRYEREHGMTLDTTRAMINLGGHYFEFIDVPGHRYLIKNMLTGASEAIFAVLVIDVLEGIKPQTIKHLEIADFLGIDKIIIAVNKMDAIANSKQRFEEAKNKFAKILEKKHLLKKASIIPISAFTGNNLIKKTSVLAWYKGPTLFKAILNDFKNNQRKQITPRQSKTSMIRPICIFIENPKGKLILEAANGQAAISSIVGFQKIHFLHQINLKLNKPLLSGDKFVIKQKGKIIGICKKAPK